MPKPSQPFMGMKLSNLTSPTAPSLDQKLFTPTPPSSSEAVPVNEQLPARTKQDTTVASNQATKTETKQPRNRDAKQPGNQDSILEVVRLAVKELGRVVGTHRYTPEEKQALEELVYEYGRKNVHTSGNEIIRIGLNYLLEDYRLHKNDSILARVLERLNA